MRAVVQTNAFLRDLKKAKKRNKSIAKLDRVVECSRRIFRYPCGTDLTR